MVAKARSVRLLAVLAVLGVATSARAQGPFPPAIKFSSLGRSLRR